MRNKTIQYIIISILVLATIACVKTYEPPETKTDYNFLVVDGVINTGPGSSTTITLSRTRKLSDTVTNSPELHAVVEIEGESGGFYTLQDQGNGDYGIGELHLNPAIKYRLRIRTRSGPEYASEFVSIKTTPPIDSITWKQDHDVTIFVNTHDPTNQTRYYRWEYVETWEYHSYYDSHLGYANGQVYFRDSTDLRNKCWSTFRSKDIITASTIKLSEDIVSQQPLTTIIHGSEKMHVKYSILVKQFGLTQEAFQYWELLKKITQELGTLFDAQPAQLTGNIRNLSNPEEPVIGYVSISTTQEKRIFIRRVDIGSWQAGDFSELCEPIILFPNQIQDYLSNPVYAPAYYVTGGLLAIAKLQCVDCTTRGGGIIKPSFW